jgi:GTPase
LGGRGTLLSRLGGGIGTRGPGEQQLEFDRRRIRGRIRRLTQSIERVRSERALHRAHRREKEFVTIAMVGYTNAGKSTLFNALTRAQVSVSPRMFATLDPTVRLLRLPSRRQVLLSDTVGFIRRLPPHLVTAFRATLEELEEASLLLHVIDVSQPIFRQKEAAVGTLLESLGLGVAPLLRIWNKTDLLDSAGRDNLPAGPDDIAISAVTGRGFGELLQCVDQRLVEDPVVEAVFNFSAGDGEQLALLYSRANVLSRHFEDDRVVVRARLPRSLCDRIVARSRITVTPVAHA